MVDRAETKTSGGIGETIKVVIQALLLALVIRTFLFQPFSIPSGSMMPTLLQGDYLFVSKWSYGFSKYSFPSLPPYVGYLPIEGRTPDGVVADRGDVIVFRKPHEEETDYIKRVVGLPGDRIQVRNGVLFINDTAVPREPAGEFVDENGSRVQQYRETLPNGVSYLTLDLSPVSAGDNTREFLVPPGHYFMMGDNRDNSLDSRFDVGYVPAENLVGKAQIIFFSVGGDNSPLEFWKWPVDLRVGRFFTWLS
ncbi:signal peptidase I [Aureimonas psammosilenae]|uniref:signal peptidase I n=1 Tax=Aureimonas psammosilenae TaxID=2495496 RepID=UPI0012606EAA|nr:signal peptidase I [Aureimonas psammosilenae]